MSPRLHLLSAIPLIAAGVLAGRAIPSSADDAPGNTGSMVDRRSRNGATEERGYLARLRATVDRGDSGKLLRPGMERLDIGNLDALAREQMEKNRATGRWSDHRTVADAALAELYRREGAAALERVSRWPEPEERENAVSAIMLLHIYADWESAMSLLEKFPQPVDESWLSAAMKEAAGRNADDFLHVAALMPERDRMDPFSSPRAVEFAADFDFAKVHAEGRLEEGEIYFKEWSYRQPDAAWDAVKDTLSTEVGSGWQPLERILPDLVEGVVGREGELAGMDWLGGKVADLPPEARAALFDVGILGFCVSGEALTRFCSHLPPADVRDYIQGQIHVSKEVFYPVMDQLPRQELIPLLKWMVEGSVWDGEGTAARLQQRFSLTADEVQRIKRATQE
ncbi:hypothetical protein OVA24_16385 [Luteolibacter sp. SL250]|uniref:hypothetical protein n=1 Tax=Luteolibacter sp. SL250 TaxID=2995170 RepID=UPI002271F9DE|nr:hypothetical protein [Luteolibacter sp. SL250]WAC18809.1 hypothetical protein OVA24_16385 [Luteolibacter sp. SL250]